MDYLKRMQLVNEIVYKIGDGSEFDIIDANEIIREIITYTILNQYFTLKIDNKDLSKDFIQLEYELYMVHISSLFDILKELNKQDQKFLMEFMNELKNSCPEDGDYLDEIKAKLKRKN